jgi:hypothetical protein
MTDDLMAWAGAVFVTVLALGGVVAVSCAALALLTTTLAFATEKLRELADPAVRDRNQRRNQSGPHR